jgi:S-formylglutathione hydrolase FrmB
MGGYGALKLGLTLPERFGKIGAMSAVADIAWVGRKEGNMDDLEVASIFTSRTGMIGTDDDLHVLLKKPAPACGRPQLYMRCGDADFLIRENREFVKLAAEAGNWDLDYAEAPGEAHTWEFWMAQLPGIFDFFSK